MATYTVEIGGVEHDVLKDNAELNLQANWQGTLACDLPSYDASYRPDIREDVVLKIDGVAKFGGILTQAPERGLGGPNLNQIVHHLSAVDYSTYLTYRYVTETIAAGTTLKAALQVLDDYLPSGVTLDPAQVTGPNLSQEFVFIRTRLDEALKALTGDTGYLPEIDPDKLFRMVSPASNPAPFDILDTGDTESGGLLYQVGDLVVERTLDDNYANRIIGEVRGSGPATSTETFGPSDYTTVGGYRYFTAKYPASININDMWPNVLLFDGVVQGPIGRVVTNPQSWDVPTNAWDWDMTVEPARLRYTIASGAGFPTTEDIQITYAIAFPFYVEGNDTADQALHPIKEAFVFIDESLSIDAAQAFVDAEATRRAATITRVRYTTEHSSLRPGMSQTITVAARGIDEDCLITEVRGYCPPERPGSDWLYDITAIVGTNEAGNVRQTYKDWLKQGGAGSARTGTSGANVAPPLLSVQFNRDGQFGGNAALTLNEAEASLLLGSDLEAEGDYNLLVGEGHTVN